MIRFFIFTLLLCVSPLHNAQADMLNLTGSEKSPTIAEFYVNADHVKAVLEIGQRDQDKLTAQDFIIEADGRKLTPKVKFTEIRPRKSRLSRRPISPVGPVSKEVRYLEVIYPFNGQPKQLTISPPQEDGYVKSTIGFVTFHENLPIHDFRFLGATATLNLNWDDPWYSRYDNINLKRHHKDPVFSFLYVDPYEVRYEALIRVRDLEPWMDDKINSEITIEEQDALLAKVAQIILEKTPIFIDGKMVTPIIENTEFLELGLSGVTARTSPVVENRNSAIAGITLTYLTEALPEQVTAEWTLFSDTITLIPSQAIDIAGPLRYLLTREDAKIVWNNYLKNYSAPSIKDIKIERKPLLQSIFRRNVIPKEDSVEKIASLALKNIYRAFDFQKEDMIYDKLAHTVSGDALTDIYLQHKKTMLLEDEGGAKARVKNVEITEVKSVSDLPDQKGFKANVMWSIDGLVTHWGHSHNRQNNYDATISFVPVDGTWKIQNIKLHEKLREL